MRCQKSGEPCCPQARIFLAELARSYHYKADINTAFSMMPMPHPVNGLPVRMWKL